MGSKTSGPGGGGHACGEVVPGLDKFHQEFFRMRALLEDLEEAKQELRVLFEKANKSRCRCSSRGPTAATQRPLRAGRQRVCTAGASGTQAGTRYLQLYLTLCEETMDYATLAEGCSYFRSKGH